MNTITVTFASSKVKSGKKNLRFFTNNMNMLETEFCLLCDKHNLFAGVAGLNPTVDNAWEGLNDSNETVISLVTDSEDLDLIFVGSFKDVAAMFEAR